MSPYSVTNRAGASTEHTSLSTGKSVLKWYSSTMFLVYSCLSFWAGVPEYYRQVSNIRRTLVGNKIVDHSDVVGASPVGAAPTTSSFST